ncbi:MAG: hypothetical protein ACJ790_12145 [Myxococcaceae bacterium]
MKGVLLGSQGQTSTLGTAVAALKVEGPIATITAGWQEYESQDEELPAQLGRETVNLTLYARTEKVFAEDKEFRAAHRARQELLRTGQDYYRLRLARMVDAALDIARRSKGSSLEADEAKLSMEYLRDIDRDHLERTNAMRAEFEAKWKPLTRDPIIKQRKEIKKLLDGTNIVAIAGGHVAVLLNRLRLFGIEDLMGKRALIAWAAGAMVTGERVLLFHEDPPQGEGVSELLEPGLGFHTGIIPLPSPRHRLKLNDPARVGWLARRNEPFRCVAFENGSSVCFDGARWYGATGTQWLKTDGTVSPEWTK